MNAGSGGPATGVELFTKVMSRCAWLSSSRTPATERCDSPPRMSSQAMRLLGPTGMELLGLKLSVTGKLDPMGQPSGDGAEQLVVLRKVAVGPPQPRETSTILPGGISLHPKFQM